MHFTAANIWGFFKRKHGKICHTVNVIKLGYKGELFFAFNFNIHIKHILLL